jgi:Spy/CpxP family protein refolding chaperone
MRSRGKMDMPGRRERHMKKLGLAVIILVGALAASLAPAAEPTSRPATRPSDGPRVDRREFAREIFDRLIKDFDLAPDQQAQLKAAVDAHAQTIAAWEKQHADEMKDLQAQFGKALLAKDKDALKTLRGKMADLAKGRDELRAKFLDQVRAALTDEQRARFDKAQAALAARFQRSAAIIAAIKELNLTPEQMQKFDKLIADAKSAAEDADYPDEREDVWRDAFDEIRATILTPEQVKKMDENRDRAQILRSYERLNLTDAQREQIVKIVADNREKMRAAKPEERRQLQRDMQDKIAKDVLTDAQREQQKRERNERGGPGPGGPGGPGMGGPGGPGSGGPGDRGGAGPRFGPDNAARPGPTTRRADNPDKPTTQHDSQSATN